MDSINPQEQITISSPATGTYEVYVTIPSTSYTTNAAVVVTCHGSVISEFATTTKQVNEIFSPTGSEAEIDNESASESASNLTDTTASLPYIQLPSSFNINRLREMPFL